MQRPSALLAICFCAGLLAALFNSLAACLSSALGLPALADITMTAELSKLWIYPRLITGGLWGLTYFFTVGRRGSRRYWVRKGLWISLLPSAVQLFFTYPEQTPYGLLGLGLGPLTPILVILSNLIWGFFIGIFTRLLWGRE
jgi:hypothetical protein